MIHLLSNGFGNAVLEITTRKTVLHHTQVTQNTLNICKALELTAVAKAVARLTFISFTTSLATSLVANIANVTGVGVVG